MRHGGDIETFKEKLNQEFIDFSSNINPFGIPREIEEEISSSISDLKRYPDIQYRELKKYLGKYLKCHKDNILVGNGVMELIDHAISLYDKILLVHPSFLEYEERAKLHGLKIDSIVLKGDLSLNQESGLLDKIQEGQLLILGNPNNPTGYRIEENYLKEIYKKICEKNGMLVLDEAFYEFTPMEYNSIDLFKNRLQNIIILRAATKFFALPGIRLGYGVTNIDMKKKIEERSLPWSVNTLAAKAGTRLHELEEYSKKSRRYFKEERQRIFNRLENLQGIKYYKSQANYVLLEFLTSTGKDCLDYMLERGIIVRTCDNYQGLTKKHIRFAIRNREENDYFIENLKEFLKG